MFHPQRYGFLLSFSSGFSPPNEARQQRFPLCFFSSKKKKKRKKTMESIEKSKSENYHLAVQTIASKYLHQNQTITLMSTALAFGQPSKECGHLLLRIVSLFFWEDRIVTSKFTIFITALVSFPVSGIICRKNDRTLYYLDKNIGHWHKYFFFKYQRIIILVLLLRANNMNVSFLK